MAVKRIFGASNLAIGAEAYSSYAIQSLMKDYQSLVEMMDQGEDISPTLAMMEQWVWLLSISFDSLGAAASTAGSSIATSRQLWLRLRKAAAAKKALLMKIPFSGVKLFGPPLEDMIKKSAEDRKLMAPKKVVRRDFLAIRGFGWPGREDPASPFMVGGKAREPYSTDKCQFQTAAASFQPTVKLLLYD